MSIFSRSLQHARRSSSGRARVLVTGLAAIMGLIALVAGLAFGFWVSTDSSYPAAALADSIPQGATPNQPVATPNPNSSMVHITFSQVSTTAGDVPITSYTLNRYAYPGGTETKNVGSCSAPSGGMVTCTDTPGNGQWQYTDTPKMGTNWVGKESAESPSVIVDTTPPTVTVGYPTSGTTYGTNWQGSITGMASASNGATVSSVNVAIENTTPGSDKWWNGSSFGSSSQVFEPVTTFTAPNWSYTLAASGNLVSGDSYSITAQATDSVGNVGTSSPATTFTYNTTAPSPSAPVPSATTHYGTNPYWVNAETVGLTDTVTYIGAGTVSSVSYYFCSTSSCTASNGTFIGTSTTGSSWSVNWTITTNVPTNDAIYYVVAVATDSLSNVGTSSTTEIGVDRTPPNVPAPTVNGFP